MEKNEKLETSSNKPAQKAKRPNVAAPLAVSIGDIIKAKKEQKNK